MLNLKRNDTNELTEQKETQRHREQTYGCQGDGTVSEFAMDRYTLLYLKWITNKDLLYKHMELCSMLCGSLDGRRVWRRMGICRCMAKSLCCPPETITTLLISHTPIQNK